MAYHTVATVEEIAPGTGTAMVINGRTIAVFNLDGAFYAIDDTCPHRGAPLSQGECEGTEVICPLHGARFDVKTGANLTPPLSAAVATYKVQVIDNQVQIELPG